MNIYFSKNIKRLRKERELTQEALADFLGVSFQAVSKWERGESYPDIELLPAIASFFEISIDELLGADKSIKEARIKSYIELYDNMSLKETSDVFNEYKNAIKEFPNEFAILIRYMELLQIERNHMNAERDSKEIDLIFEKIQNYCTDDEIRIRSKRLMIDNLMWQYETMGYNEQIKLKAERIIDSLPELKDSKEIALTKTANADNWYQVYEKEIEELIYLLQNAVVSYCYYSKEFTAEFKINVIEHMNGLIKLIDTDENLTKSRIHLIYNLGHLGRLYYEKGDNKTALHYFKLAAQQALAFDSIYDSERALLYYEQEERFRNMSMRERMKELMTEHYPLSDEFKSTSEFQKILRIME